MSPIVEPWRTEAPIVIFSNVRSASVRLVLYAGTDQLYELYGDVTIIIFLKTLVLNKHQSPSFRCQSLLAAIIEPAQKASFDILKAIR